jgi:hypothetical protein
VQNQSVATPPQNGQGLNSAISPLLLFRSIPSYLSAGDDDQCGEKQSQTQKDQK